MKREKFVEEVEKLEFYVNELPGATEVVNKFNRTLGTIRENCPYRLDTEYYELDTLKDDEEMKLFDLMVEYAKTPIWKN